MISSVTLLFQKVKIKIEAKYPEFIEFIADYFAKNIIQDDTNDILVSFEILSKKEFDAIILDYVKAENYTQLSRSIYFSNRSVLLNDISYLPGLKLSFNLENDKLKVTGYYHDQTSFKNILRKFTYHKSNNLGLFLYLKYYLILFPLIWYYENFRNRYLIHASGLVYKNKAILFPGLGGVGKSTLVISLMRNPEFEFISDNLVLYGENEVIPIYEAVALDRKSMSLCENSLPRLKPLNIQISHARRYFKVDQVVDQVEKVQNIYFLKLSPKTEINVVSKEQAYEKMLLINNIAKEVQEYMFIASALNLSFNRLDSIAKSGSIMNLIKNAKCFELGIRPHESLEIAHSLLMDHLG